ncbi:MAG TPA: hypothetical protein VF779_15715 [Pyrinomonadaceae bacterium]
MARLKIAALSLLITLVLITPSASNAQTRKLDLGGLIVSVSDSRTAQVFHIVDQMSDWDSAVHHGYVRWAAKTLNLGLEDRKLLQKHAEMRRARGWGNGFEQAFYVDDSIEVAAERAVENKLISADEAAAEKTILLHFAPMLSEMLNRNAPQLAAFRKRLEAEGKKIAPIVRKLVRFSETQETISVPLFLVPNPEEGSGGGGFNGGRLVVEIQKEPDPLPILFHECLHALLWQHKEAIRAAAESLGLSWGALNEGIAHAFSPGITDDLRESDSLAERLTRNLQKGTPASDRSAQQYMIALLIRPLLRSALERGETFRDFLPKAIVKLRNFSWH